MSLSLQDTFVPPPPGYTVNLIDPESLGHQLIIASIVPAVFTTIFLALRLYTRAFLVRSLGWDDGLITLAWVFSIVLSVTECVDTKWGLGIHIWNITIERFNVYLKFQIVLGASYLTALALAKISILCFYLRLSPSKKFRWVVYGVMAFVAASSLAALLVFIFACNPVAAAWDLVQANDSCTVCINRPADYLAQSSLNILTDIIIFILPLQMIWRLQLPFRQKLSVSVLLALGLLICIISMIRLKAIVVVLNSNDVTWDNNDLGIWSVIEVHMAIICASIATLRPLLRRLIPRLFDHSSDESSSLSASNRNTKSGGSPGPAESFPLENYNGRGDLGQHAATTTSNPVRDPRHRYGDAESQESIMGDMGQEVDVNTGVLETRT